MAELTLEEAREICKQSDASKSLMLTKFSKEELEKNDVSQEEFDKTFLELLAKCTKTEFLDTDLNISKLPTNIIRLADSDNNWMFNIQFTGEHKHFWVNYDRVWSIFEAKYRLQYGDIKRLMLNQITLRFRMKDITPLLTSPYMLPVITLNKEELEKSPYIQVKMKYDILNNMMNGLSEYAFYTEFADLFKKCGCPVFLDDNSKPTTIPTNRIAYMDSSNTWLFDIKYTGNPPHFYVSKSRVFSAFAKKYNMNSEDFRRYIDKFAEIKFGIYGSVCIF